MKFHVLPSKSVAPKTGYNEVYLIIDNWNDYSFITSFEICVFDDTGERHELESVRIGFVGQTTKDRTYEKLSPEFSSLPNGFFSLGMNVAYYQKLSSEIPKNWVNEFLERMRDVVFSDDILAVAENEQVFKDSHLRSISISLVRDQYRSVLQGEVLLTDFNFGFCLPPSSHFAGFDLAFSVEANSTPSTNMHALIGRNGVGKTTLLNSMIKSIASDAETESYFYTEHVFGGRVKGDGFVNNLVSVAFSAFDPFDLPTQKDDDRYAYIGLTDYAAADGAILKSKDDLFAEFVDGLVFCFEDDRRKNRWAQAVQTLQSDENFAEMDLMSLLPLAGEELRKRALFLIGKMSSGHSVVILTMTLLVARVKEKSLVLFDEPESHLHPPLLSALMRSLAQLLHTRNAIAIIATHSPVVLQEIPKSCVWKVFRSRLASEKKRPDTETFGENVGILTREVFGLEVEQSGYHTVLTDLVSNGGTYEDLLKRLEGRLGYEARGILRAMVANQQSE
ncbi:AAA family ATPase [Pseudovibrio sp. Alg231-02]|uniref:AAA family ATPase n=1 Tax=Pseudovibrio sp. Alg231-02 TaxID=1922223 RepID=UPI000D553BF7|nr:AAA family ATPase [Pseudovibrio sp. Alg231-02]